MPIHTNSVIIAIIVIAGNTSAHADPPVCRTRQDLAGACYRVFGDLALFNGTPSARISVFRSHRVLGIASYIDDNNETFIAPKAVRERASFDWKLRGNYEVCPLEKSTQMRMQTVCIESGKRLKKTH
jgi:hypothetical protein